MRQGERGGERWVDSCSCGRTIPQLHEFAAHHRPKKSTFRACEFFTGGRAQTRDPIPHSPSCLGSPGIVPPPMRFSALPGNGRGRRGNGGRPVVLETAVLFRKRPPPPTPRLVLHPFQKRLFSLAIGFFLLPNEPPQPSLASSTSR